MGKFLSIIVSFSTITLLVACPNANCPGFASASLHVNEWNVALHGLDKMVLNATTENEQLLRTLALYLCCSFYVAPMAAPSGGYWCSISIQHCCTSLPWLLVLLWGSTVSVSILLCLRRNFVFVVFLINWFLWRYPSFMFSFSPNNETNFFPRTCKSHFRLNFIHLKLGWLKRSRGNRADL